MYTVGALAEFLTGIVGVTPVVYRIWYLSGAIFTAAYLGLGTVYLLVRQRFAHIIMLVLLIASIYAVIKVFVVDIDLSHLRYLSSSAMPQSVRILTPFFNTFGTIALIGGAIYSAWVYWRQRHMPYRVLSNIMIAIGAMMPALGGIIMRYGGSQSVFYILELAGILVIFGGFLRNREVFGLYRIPFIHGFSKVTIK